MNTQDLHISINKLLTFIGIAESYVFNIKAKNNSFFHRYRVNKT